MNEYILITAKGTRNGFIIEAWDMSGAIAAAKEYVKEGWRIYGIVASGEVHDSEMTLNAINN